MGNSTIAPVEIERDQNLQQALKENLADLNKLLGERNKEILGLERKIGSRDEKIKKLEGKNHSSGNILKDLESYISLDRINKMAEQLKLDSPLTLLIPKYIPSRVKEILGTRLSNNEIVALAQRSDLFEKDFLVIRNKRILGQASKHQTTVFFSILGIIELFYWHTWEEKHDSIFNEVMLESKLIFKYLKNR